jgi:hypothetical protein
MIQVHRTQLVNVAHFLYLTYEGAMEMWGCLEGMAMWLSHRRRAKRL